MQTDILKRTAVRLLATTAFAALLAAAPLSADINPETGMISITSATALAKGDNSGSGGGGDSGSGGGGDDNSGSGGGDDDNSGSGGGGGDNSGSGGGGDDDNSGSGGGGGDNSGHGGGDDDDPDDVEDEDHAGGHADGHGGGNRDGGDGPKVEIVGDNIEITYADGTKEEIEDGVYERKNAAGRTVEERPANQADIDRLTIAAASGDFDTATRGSDDGVVKTEISGNSVEVTYSDGTKEEIENGVYERKNAAGRTVEERPATQADFDRLASVANGGASGGTAGGSAPGGGSIGTVSGEREFVLNDGTKIEVTGNNIEVKYSDGWKEEIEAGRYELKDPSGNTVVDRAATAGDRNRLQAQLPG